jgi:2',3'-cyclic-nucleotide 2'-phosphodiesterase (5'-nucleotidase family)
VTRRDVVAMAPFGNVVMTLELTGRTLRAVLEQALPQRDREAGGFLQVSGMTVTFDPARPAGERVVAIEIGGAPLDPDRRYTVAVPDYIAGGKDGLTAFRGARVLVGATNARGLVEVLLDAVAAQGTIAPQTEGRLRTIDRR